MKNETEKRKCVVCMEPKDECQLDTCYGCGGPVCEWCQLETEGWCNACAQEELKEAGT